MCVCVFACAVACACVCAIECFCICVFVCIFECVGLHMFFLCVCMCVFMRPTKTLVADSLVLECYWYSVRVSLAS